MSTNHTELDTLRARCARLERAGAALLVLAGAVLLMGQTQGRARPIEATAFMLVDEAGRDRGQLAVGKDGAAQLYLKNGDGVTDASFALLPDGTLALRMRSPRKTAAMEIAPDGIAALRITEKYAKSSVELGVDSAGRPRLILTDPQGKIAFKAP